MQAKEVLRRIIAEEVFVKNTEEQIEYYSDPDRWIFDFRRILMNGKNADLVSEIFYEEFKDAYPFQLCALEIAGVPLVTSLMTKFFYKGHTDVNAFFIRKSRKKSGLLRMIEGTVEDTKDIILVDDIMNSGNTFWRQIEVLDELGYKIDTVWTILRFRDLNYYTRFTNRGITVRSLFTLDDFTEVLGENVRNLSDHDPEPPKMPFEPHWKFKSEDPSLGWVVPKSQPVIDAEKLYFGADNQTFWALNQADGSVAWKDKVGAHTKKKSIFSNPALYKDMVIFGSYDGNVYALERTTGKKRWIFFDADWVGSSPAIADDLGMVFIGLEFGLIRKRGGIAALDAKTGKAIWTDYSHPAFTHCSPHYIPEHRQVVIGSNDGVARLYDAKDGTGRWQFTTFGGAAYDPQDTTGFGEGDIKESFAYDPRRDLIIFGSMDGFLYVLERATGYLVHHHKCEFGIYSTPCLYKDRVYFTSLDKHVRCIDLKTFELVFEKNLDGTRIFGSPVVHDGKLYVGTNAARLHELDPETGEELGYFQALERITNAVVFNGKTGVYFLPTYANEIIQLTRKPDAALSSSATT